jgi:hypothetical protein
VLCGKGVSIQNIRSALKRFQKLHFLTNESTKTGRKLTICNYNSYQKQDSQANKATNSQVTKTQQRGNKEVTPNNKDNNNNKPPRKSPGKDTWLTPFMKIWDDVYGGKLPEKSSVGALQNVIKRYGEQDALMGWNKYCQSTNGQYASAPGYAKIAGTFITKPKTRIIGGV